MPFYKISPFETRKRTVEAHSADAQAIAHMGGLGLRRLISQAIESGYGLTTELLRPETITDVTPTDLIEEYQQERRVHLVHLDKTGDSATYHRIPQSFFTNPDVLGVMQESDGIIMPDMAEIMPVLGSTMPDGRIGLRGLVVCSALELDVQNAPGFNVHAGAPSLAA